MFKLCKPDILLDAGCRLFAIVDKHRIARASADCLQSHLTASRKQIQEICPGHFILYDIKQRLLDPIRGRSRIHSLRCLKRQASRRSSYDSHMVPSSVIVRASK